MIKHVNGNIQAFNEKYLDRTPITPTLPDDQAIVERVAYDMRPILEHADILYKNYVGLGWRPYSYKCRHCDTKVTRSLETFIRHLETCKGLDD